MSSSSKSISSCSEDDNDQLRRGPWTLEEDNLLIHFISLHGEGRWNLLAKRSGLRRTGKSCRLRWLNYLKPDVKRGNLSPQEQLLILDLHSKWGNRWSKIAQFLPGRTDNEIKNYWRTRVQKQARYLNIETNSEAFHQIIRCYWIPRLIQKIEESSSSSSPAPAPAPPYSPAIAPASAAGASVQELLDINEEENSGKDYSTSFCDSSSQLTQVSEYPIHNNYGRFSDELLQVDNNGYAMEIFNSAAEAGDICHPLAERHVAESDWMDIEFTGYMGNVDELWQFKN